METPHKINAVSHKYIYLCPLHYCQLSSSEPTSNVPCFAHALKQTLFEKKNLIVCPYFLSKGLGYLIASAEHLWLAYLNTS